MQSSPRSMSHVMAYIPECRPDILSPAWFDWLKEIGYTGVYVENDPFQPSRSGNASQFPTLYRLISLYDLAWGEQRERLRDWIALACDLAHERQMKVYLKVWEPRIPVEAWGLFPREWRGRGGWDRLPWNQISWCLSVPEALTAFEDMATEAFRHVSGLDGVIIGTHDNDACVCNDTCPRCQDMTRAEQIRIVFSGLTQAVERAGLHRPDFEYVPYTWWLKPEELAVLTPIFESKKTLISSRSTFGLKQYWQGKEIGTVTDLALGLTGISDHFKNELEVANGHGWSMLDTGPYGHSLEYFWLPYTPAPNRVAERLCDLRELGVSGWLDYDCGGVYPGINTEIIRDFQSGNGQDAHAVATATLARLYPEAELEAANQAYMLAEAALALRPVGFNSPDVANLSGRCTIEICMGLPFDPGMISGWDQGHRIWFSTPANFMTPGAIPTLRGMFAESLNLWEQADASFGPLQGMGQWQTAVLPWEKKVVRAHLLVTRSVCRFLEMSDNRLARGRGQMDAATEREHLMPLIERELADTRQFHELWNSDRRLMGNSNIRLTVMVQECVPWIALQGDDPFASKISWMEAFLVQLQAGKVWDAVPAFAAPV